MATSNNHEHVPLSKEISFGADAEDLASTIDPLNPDSDLPMDNSTWEYCRIDPSNDENIHLVEGITVHQGKGKEREHYDFQLPSNYERGVSTSAAAQFDALHAAYQNPSRKGSLLTALPSELIDHILSFLDPISLTSVSSLCRLLSQHARSDLSWQYLVQANVPGTRITSPAPFKTFRELYEAHDPHWFIPKYKVWFSDTFLTGKIIITRYDPRRCCIEGYRLVAERPMPTFQSWEVDDEVVIHSFNPKCRLHMDEPELQLNVTPTPKYANGENRFNSEKPMPISPARRYPLRCNLILARPVDTYPGMQLWPPPLIPARERVRNSSQDGFISAGHRPQKRSELSDQTFRIRRWVEMTGPRNGVGVHMGEEMHTYSTLDPRLYTPTEDKPYRGIWVGDYSGHGSEFLLMHQPDDEEPYDEANLIQRDDETPEEFEARKRDERIYRGSIEAIKLTGDPNIPRGEYTFVADDISRNGLIRVATDNLFKGARIVKSRGHIATRMFKDDKYIETQLILISPNRLAQYWVGFGHISYFERVDIDAFTAPTHSQTVPETSEK